MSGVTRQLDVNAVVSYNVKAARERLGLTQQAVAVQLATITGHRLPQASISAMERGFDGDRRRRFHAHELYLLSLVFDVPIVYFFIPPPVEGRVELADSLRPIEELLPAVLGRDSQLAALDERLVEIKRVGAGGGGADRVLSALYGSEIGGPDWRTHFRTWRHRRLEEIEQEYGDCLAEAAKVLGRLAREVQASGPAAYLQAMADGHR